MEGYTAWYMGTIMAIFGLMWLSGVPALAAVGFLLARRPHRALTLFATALLCEAILVAVLLQISAWGFDLTHWLPGLSLLLAGTGQFVATLRSPRTYASTLPFAVSAAVVVWLNVLNPDWRGLPAAATSLALAAASLIIAVLPFGSRQAEAEGAETEGPGRTRR